jgi:aspartyl-tRNA(Asn)/glutamyl-tRNA(Gln) amidotransferase subunit A
MEPLTIKQIQSRIRGKEISCKELTGQFLDAIKQKDKDIHAYLEVSEEMAMKQAEKVDLKIASGKDTGELEGVPLAIKDNILVEGFKCTAGSKILENYNAPYDATVSAKLRKAGAIFLGKTNLDEFAMGSSTENSAFGPTKNPHDLSKVPGGSSGGSAAAVASLMCVAALGSDTGGSIRQPAAFCGVVGFKPTYGAVSRYGLIAMASSLDQIGPITHTVEDSRIMFDVILGKDGFDATSLDTPRNTQHVTCNKLKIGVPKEYFGVGIDAQIKNSVEKAIKKYEENGAKIQEISLPHTEYGIAVYYVIMPSEVSSNLARYDGIRYGVKVSRQEGFGDEVRKRIMLGTHTLSSGYYDAYYLRAQKVRRLIKQDFDKAFSKIDVIMTPTAPTSPFAFGEKTKDPVSMYLSDIFTVGANLAGLPALSIPCGAQASLQIIGPQKSDYTVFNVAQIYEEITK